MTKAERLDALQRIANVAGSIMGSAEAAIDEAEYIPRMDNAEAERLSLLLPQLEKKLRQVGAYIYPLPEKYMYMAECETSAEEADHRDWVRSQGVLIDNQGIPIDENGNPLK